VLISTTDSAAPAGVYRVVSGNFKRADLVAACLPIALAQEGLAHGYLYRELGPTYFEQRRVEQLKRRCLDQLQNLGFEAKLVPLPKATFSQQRGRFEPTEPR